MVFQFFFVRVHKDTQLWLMKQAILSGGLFGEEIMHWHPVHLMLHKFKHWLQQYYERYVSGRGV